MQIIKYILVEGEIASQRKPDLNSPVILDAHNRFVLPGWYARNSVVPLAGGEQHITPFRFRYEMGDMHSARNISRWEIMPIISYLEGEAHNKERLIRGYINISTQGILANQQPTQKTTRFALFAPEDFIPVLEHLYTLKECMIRSIYNQPRLQSRY